MTDIQTIRIGIVGAGGNTRKRHVPGFRAIEGVEIVGVVNRSPESTASAAEEFGIPKTYPSWQALIDPKLAFEYKNLIVQLLIYELLQKIGTSFHEEAAYFLFLVQLS